MRLLLPLFVLVVLLAVTAEANGRRRPAGGRSNGRRRSAGRVGADGRRIEPAGHRGRYNNGDEVEDCKQRNAQNVGRERCERFIRESCAEMTMNPFAYRPEIARRCVAHFCDSKEARCEVLAGLRNACHGRAEPLFEYNCQ
ncbi:hypothetical protein M3Y99_00746000 [Aphelenchoides fujianensis]|nr:hypothetical protein M3Y99_00746000 [Aphelenchoides fujianensis]